MGRGVHNAQLSQQSTLIASVTKSQNTSKMYCTGTQSVSHSICQSLNLSVTQSDNHSVCQSLNLSVTQSVNHSVCQSISLSVTQSVTVPCTLYPASHEYHTTFIQPVFGTTCPLSNQIKVFGHLEDVNQIPKIAIFHNRRRPQGNTLKMENRHLSKSTPPAGQR